MNMTLWMADTLSADGKGRRGDQPRILVLARILGALLVLTVIAAILYKCPSIRTDLVRPRHLCGFTFYFIAGYFIRPEELDKGTVEDLKFVDRAASMRPQFMPSRLGVFLFTTGLIFLPARFMGEALVDTFRLVAGARRPARQE